MIAVEKVAFLSDVPMFEHVQSAELAKIAEITHELVVPAGKRVFSEGDYGDELYIIVEGAIRITLGDRTLASLGARDYFGEMSLLDGEPRSASALAMEDTLLLRIRQADFHKILARNFDATLAVIRTLSRRLRTQQSNGTGGSPDR
jgi:CRP/FNR family cyclic AMP-dependent transcriptional regulator